MQRHETSTHVEIVLGKRADSLAGTLFSGIRAVNFLSLAAIALLSGSMSAPIVVAAYTIVTFFYIKALHFTESDFSRKVFYRLYFLLHAALFLFLQDRGFIGILNAENVTAGRTLPFLIGFSFYILQSIAICNAVFKRKIEPLDFDRYTLAISFCGAFLAGPIFNRDQLQQFGSLNISWPHAERVYDESHLLIGALFFKYVCANWLSQWVDIKEIMSPLKIASSVLCFELQVYFDFAGYSLLALFLCRIFGIPIYFNFQHPFSARDIPEFWRRWHIGLGTWFKENVFLAAKESINGKWATRGILPLLVFFASASWHGPTRNFLLWGLFHGLAFVIAINFICKIGTSWPGRLVSRIYLILVIFYGRLLFMDSDFPRLMHKFKQLGMFKAMVKEFLQLVSSFSALTAHFFAHWDDFLIGFFIAALVCYELFFEAARSKTPYRYLKPGGTALFWLILTLLFFQPLQRIGFVYGR
jgi:D-alanyl-lipoteichoic acid acyltransferase DltB (MBOAT superfamily)